MQKNIDALLKECENLGIINIEAHGGLSTELIQDAIDSVKAINLDFDKIATQMNKERAATR